MKKNKVYVVIMLYPSCGYGDACATCKVFEKESEAKKYMDKQKYDSCFCHIEEEEVL